MALQISRGRLPQPIPGARYTPGSPGEDISSAISQVLPAYMQAAQQARENKQRQSLLHEVSKIARSGDVTDDIKGAMEELEGMESEEITLPSIMGVVQKHVGEDPLVAHVGERADRLEEMSTLGRLGRAFSPVAEATRLLPEEEQIIQQGVQQAPQVREMEMFNTLLQEFRPDRPRPGETRIPVEVEGETHMLPPAEARRWRQLLAEEEAEAMPDTDDPFGLLGEAAEESIAPVRPPGSIASALSPFPEQPPELADPTRTIDERNALRGVLQKAQTGVEAGNITSRDEVVKIFREYSMDPHMYDVERHISRLNDKIQELEAENPQASEKNIMGKALRWLGVTLGIF